MAAKKKLTKGNIQYNGAADSSIKKADVYIIMSAVEDSRVSTPLLDNIHAYKRFIETKLKKTVEISCIPVPYTVRDTFHARGYDQAIVPYLCSSRVKLHKYLQIGGDIAVLPTTKYPINGLESESGQASLIIGSPKAQYKPQVTISSIPKKIITTCACTFPRYTRSRIGIHGKDTHKLGFLVVEMDPEAQSIPYETGRS